MIKFTEQLTESTPKKLFTDLAINELKELVKNNNNSNNQDFGNQKPNVSISGQQSIQDTTTPAKVIKTEPKFDKKNLFSLPSIITALFFVLSTVYVDYDAALEDGRISRRERLKLIYLLAGAVSVLVSRATEGKSQVYTPRWAPGPHLTDLDNDNDIDEQDQKLWEDRNKQ